MKIAFTGASSTGKTTLATNLFEESEFTASIDRLISVDARSMIKNCGCNNIDDMTQEQLKEFDLNYFDRKIKSEESYNKFLTERSFVDVAAFLVIRNCLDAPQEWIDLLVEQCKRQSLKYDLTVYLPFGIFPFESDGYRSNKLEFHKKIDQKIKEYLSDWGVNFITLDTPDIEERVKMTLTAMRLIKS